METKLEQIRNINKQARIVASYDEHCKKYIGTDGSEFLDIWGDDLLKEQKELCRIVKRFLEDVEAYEFSEEFNRRYYDAGLLWGMFVLAEKYMNKETRRRELLNNLERYTEMGCDLLHDFNKVLQLEDGCHD